MQFFASSCLKILLLLLLLFRIPATRDTRRLDYLEKEKKILDQQKNSRPAKKILGTREQISKSLSILKG